MKKLLARLSLCTAAVLACAAPAQAQMFRAYVASTGADANPCTVSAPCRLLNRALEVVASGGEIWVLDSANFNQGTLVIDKSVSILAVPGQVGSILAVSGTPAIIISGSGLIVALRNLVVTKNVANPGTNGIMIYSTGIVSLEDCVIAGLPGVGIWPTAAMLSVHVKNTVFRDIGDLAISAVNGPNVNVANSQFFQTGGIEATGSLASTMTVVNVTDSTIAGGMFGVSAYTAAAATVRVLVTRSTIHDVTYGLYAEDYGGSGSPLVTVSDSTVAGVDWDVYIRGVGHVKSLGNNYIGDNLDGSSGTLTTTPQR